MGERRGHPVVGVFIGLLTLAATTTLAYLTWIVSADTLEGLWPTPEEGNAGLGVLLTVLAALVLVGGLWCARRVAAGNWIGPRRTWCVSRSVSLMDSPGSGGVVASLDPGAEVVEVARQGDFVQVTIADGRTGWVERRAVF